MCRVLSIDTPIVQAPMGQVTNSAMTAIEAGAKKTAPARNRSRKPGAIAPAGTLGRDQPFIDGLGDQIALFFQVGDYGFRGGFDHLLVEGLGRIGVSGIG